MKTRLKTLSKALGLMLLLITMVSSCKKDKKVDPTPTATSSMTGTIDGKTIKLDAGALTSTYYSTDGDASKALETSATLNASGDKLNFFLNDLKNGILALTKKSGTSFNPGNYKIRINADTPSPVQSYVSYFSGGNTYFAYSGSIEIIITDTSITVKWSINFKDASGREFNSAGSFTFVNYFAVTKPKSEVRDPTPVAAKPTIENISPTSGKAGDSVSITGVNYSTVATENEVKFNGVAATVKSATATRLIVTAPQTGTTGAVTLKIKNSDLTTGPTFTYVLPPVVTSLSPTSGKVGDTISINGNNFSTNTAAYVVQFNSPNGPVNGTVLSASATQVKVIVPQTAKTGVLNVIINAAANLVTPEFTVTVPPVNTGDWQDLGFTATTRENTMSVSNGTGVMFTGTDGANYLYYSSNGNQYTDVYNKLPFNLTRLGIHLLKVSGNTYYITTTKGIAKTTDGQTWTKMTPDTLSPDRSFTGMVVKDNAITLLSGGELFQSTDGGTSWVKTVVQSASGLEYISSDYNGKYFYAVNDAANSLNSTVPKKLYRSTNQGKAWAPVNSTSGLYFYDSGHTNFLEVVVSTVYCIFSTETSRSSIADQKLYKSTGQGDNWVKVSDENVLLVKSFGDYVVYTNTASLHVSNDVGATFTDYAIPAGYRVGGVERAGGKIYIFATTNDQGTVKMKIFRRQI
jgi:hypothetical protein